MILCSSELRGEKASHVALRKMRENEKIRTFWVSEVHAA